LYLPTSKYDLGKFIKYDIKYEALSCLLSEIELVILIPDNLELQLPVLHDSIGELDE
jgi:hypothetical protein